MSSSMKMFSSHFVGIFFHLFLQCSFSKKRFDRSFLYLLSLYSIDNNIQSRWHKQVYASHKSVNAVRDCMTPKSVGTKGEEGWDIGNYNGTDVGSVGTEVLLSLCWGKADHCLKDHGVGDWKHRCQSPQSGGQPLDHRWHWPWYFHKATWPKTCGHGRYGKSYCLCTREVFWWVLKKEWQVPCLRGRWETHLGNDRIGEDSSKAYRVADGHIVVQGHEHKQPRFHLCEVVEKEHLHQASTEAKLFEIKPENAEHFGYNTLYTKQCQWRRVRLRNTTWASIGTPQDKCDRGAHNSMVSKVYSHKVHGAKWEGGQKCVPSSPGTPFNMNDSGVSLVQL